MTTLSSLYTTTTNPVSALVAAAQPFGSLHDMEILAPLAVEWLETRSPAAAGALVLRTQECESDQSSDIHFGAAKVVWKTPTSLTLISITRTREGVYFVHVDLGVGSHNRAASIIGSNASVDWRGGADGIEMDGAAWLAAMQAPPPSTANPNDPDDAWWEEERQSEAASASRRGPTPYTPPRYDEVFAAGTAAIDEAE